MIDPDAQEGACRALSAMLDKASLFVDAYSDYVHGNKDMEWHLDGLLEDTANAALDFIEAHAAYNGGANHHLFSHGTN